MPGWRETYVAAFASFTPPICCHLNATCPSNGPVDRSHTVLLAEAETGWGGFCVVRPAGPAMELRRLYVPDGCQGRGIGSRSLRTALAHPDGRADASCLTCGSGNHGAPAVRAPYGFQVVGRRSFAVCQGGNDDLI